MSDKRHNNPYDLDETIQFTKDELRRLRQPNRQPMDDDYFSRQLSRAESKPFDKSVDELEVMPRKESIDDHLSVGDKGNNEVASSVHQAKAPIEKEPNPFLYQSKSKKSRQAREQQKHEQAAQVREQKEHLSRKMDALYEPVYDEYELEDLEAYNQFEDEKISDAGAVETAEMAELVETAESAETSELAESSETAEESPTVSRSAVKQEMPAKPRVQLGQWFNKTSEQVKSKMAAIKARKPVTDDIDDDEEGIDDAAVFRTESVEVMEPVSPEKETERISVELESDEETGVISSSLQDADNEQPMEEAAVKSDDAAAEPSPVTLDNADASTIDALSEQVSESTQYFEEPILTDKVLEDVLGHDDIQVEEVAEEQVSFVKGTAWLTIGNLISRILGALYVIPWATWLGGEFTNANALYSVGYRPYSLFLAISTAGFPSAIAKQMAYYNARKEYKVADKLFRNSLIVMGATGLISALLLYISAPFIAYNSATDTPAAAIVVIRSLAPALLILPVMSLLRGYFQGFGDMVPTAVSQILEQIARVVYLLVATYAIMQLLHGNVTSAVAHSTFAAFIGALLSLLYLVIVYIKRRPIIQLLFERSEDSTELDFKTSMKLLMVDSVPFILLGSGIIIAQMVDLFSFRQILEMTTTILSSDIKVMYGTMSHDVDKLIMIVISVAIGMSLSSIPLITRLYANAEVKKAAQLIEKISLVFLIFMLPAALGMASIADNMYTLFYANGSEQGPGLLVTASYLSIILGAYTLLSTILQSMNYRRLAIKYLAIGLLVKVILQFPFVALFHAHGALASTLIAFLVTSGLMLWKIHQLVSLDFKAMLPDTVIIVTAAVLMALSAGFWNVSFNALFGPVGRLVTFIKILVTVLLAAVVYGGVLALFGKLSLVIGNKHQDLQEKLRMF
ncbi:oligosaccharide flippase family protein [Tuanshanicoccus lijuaniae]|uniref:oligosaccharide flippase family protein n=1 Tax=Aerococcaceae bacterium zg-1292 TaxID=2774330 RepID=UPI001938A3A6|nr:oligosaccharide flippase family protein [Aerococcaceae bacterium zg-1292]QQA36657.1 oligosaccharide flippase family protein [Aerococcaceae bacterium zg-1292]